ncbi:CBS domain-containing protein [Streptomyces sp. NPDC020731]|uniref:CBS domain-containing protein n=1 Tax=Streptomyces sp. NPDC020731 TaxID=3365085 RepID=UPI0037AD3CE0
MARHVRGTMTGAPVTVGPRTSVAEAARIMRDRGLGSVLVTDGDRLRGPVSRGGGPEGTTVAGACSDDPVTAAPTAWTTWCG